MLYTLLAGAWQFVYCLFLLSVICVLYKVLHEWLLYHYPPPALPGAVIVHVNFNIVNINL